MADASQDDPAKKSGSDMHADGWAAWDKKADDPLKPPAKKKPAATGADEAADE